MTRTRTRVEQGRTITTSHIVNRNGLAGDVFHVLSPTVRSRKSIDVADNSGEAVKCTGARLVPADAPVGVVPARWKGYLTPAVRDGDPTGFRHYWELCVLLELRVLPATLDEHGDDVRGEDGLVLMVSLA